MFVVGPPPLVLLRTLDMMLSEDSLDVLMSFSSSLSMASSRGSLLAAAVMVIFLDKGTGGVDGCEAFMAS